MKRSLIAFVIFAVVFILLRPEPKMIRDQFGIVEVEGINYYFSYEYWDGGEDRVRLLLLPTQASGIRYAALADVNAKYNSVQICTISNSVRHCTVAGRDNEAWMVKKSCPHAPDISEGERRIAFLKLDKAIIKIENGQHVSLLNPGFGV